MTARNWKRIQPNSQQHAIRLCLDYAEKKHNRSVARIGDLIGKSEWAIYKWLADGSMPSRMIRPFEFACGCTYITQWMATSAHKLLIEIPTGKRPEPGELLELQTSFNKAVNKVAKFYSGEVEADEAVSYLTSILQEVASHRENIQKNSAPELELFEGGMDE